MLHATSDKVWGVIEKTKGFAVVEFNLIEMFVEKIFEKDFLNFKSFS